MVVVGESSAPCGPRVMPPMDTSPRLTHPSRLLVASDRPAIQAFFASLGPPVFSVSGQTLVAVAEEDLTAYDAAVVDVGLEPILGVELCRDLQARRPELAVAAVVCCPNAVSPWTLRRLLASGVAGVLDLRASQEEAARTLESIARGGSVLHLQIRRGHRELLRDILTGNDQRSETRIRLLELVGLGLPDHEIGRRLHLSPHTVKHQIEQLRRELHVRNRIELAAWAGRHGFYGTGDQPDLVPVHVAGSGRPG
jgi:two-component system, NarL family, response regulator DevR